MRGLGRLASPPTSTQFLLSSTSSHTFSTSAGGGGGRGRGRGSGPPAPTPPPPRVPGQTPTDADADTDTVVPPGLGHGRSHPLPPSSPVLPSFPSWFSPVPPSYPAPSGRGRPDRPPPPPPPPLPIFPGRGRGMPPTEAPDSQPNKPIFFRRDDMPMPMPPPPGPDSSSPLPTRFVRTFPPGAGRGKPAKPAEAVTSPTEENRHLRPRSPSAVPVTRRPQSQPPDQMGVAGGGRGGRGRGGRGVVRGRGRGGRFGGRRRGGHADEAAELYLGDNADGERLERRLGEENIKQLAEGFDEMSLRVLPSPLDDAYLDALHTNNLIEYEPEYLVEFDSNPDIDEKPPMSLEEALEKAKPFLIAYEGIQSQEEWEEAVKDVMERLPHMKELMDMYCGPDRVTAKQQQQELERVAKTLPENIPSSVKSFTDRAVLSLQSNPGWGWDKKCQFMDKLVREVSQHYS